jgi:HEAT repeat protein
LVGIRLFVLFLPALLLLLAALRSHRNANPQLLLVLGTTFQILLCCLSVRSIPGWRQPIGPSVLVLYLTGLGWLWLGREPADLNDWYLHFAQALLLLVSLVIFGFQVLFDSGAPEWRRAHVLARRLVERTAWPSPLAASRLLPEVKALREALHMDAGPALGLLGHVRPEVRIAALAALEFRKYWRPGQAELVLQIARQSAEPAVRAAAMSALANVDDRTLVEQLAEFLRDPSPEVRRAASEALLWDTGTRWPWIRLAVRRALADSQISEEGPFLPSGQLLTDDAIKDLTAWTGEKGFLAVRAALVLGNHYERVVADRYDSELITQLQQQVADGHVAAALRIQLAHLLQRHNLLERPLQEALLDPLNPSPLRLVAADSLLAKGRHAGAIAALKEVARLPNREIALTTAEIVQRRLHIDLGLPMGQSTPPIHSRLAAEVTRHVMTWAVQAAPNESSVEPEALQR